MASLITSVDLTPPLFKDVSQDTYNEMRNELISNHSNSYVYVSSQSFVEWASAENQGANVIASIFSGGGYTAELIRQIEQRLVTELSFLGTWTSQTGISLANQEILSMLTTGEVTNFGNFDVSVKAVNVPYVRQKCLVNDDECTPALKSPRLGFAIIATPK